MPICHKLKTIFIHIPKTGGTSIEKYFNIYNENGLRPNTNILHGHVPIKFEDNEYDPLNVGGLAGYNLQHLTSNEIKKLLTVQIYQKYFKFTFIRNPWDRMVSEYKWAYYSLSFEDYINRILYVVENRIKLETKNAHFRPQIEYINNDLDFIGRFENFNQDIEKVSSLIGLDFDIKKLPHEKKTNRKHYKEYYNEQTKQIINNIYKEDIKQFDYEF
tara:strand:+ start:82 stop:729 length:648 start_codon:yes stop_codon:yes gene_type:complete